MSELKEAFARGIINEVQGIEKNANTFTQWMNSIKGVLPDWLATARKVNPAEAEHASGATGSFARGEQAARAQNTMSQAEQAARKSGPRMAPTTGPSGRAAFADSPISSNANSGLPEGINTDSSINFNEEVLDNAPSGTATSGDSINLSSSNDSLPQGINTDSSINFNEEVLEDAPRGTELPSAATIDLSSDDELLDIIANNPWKTAGGVGLGLGTIGGGAYAIDESVESRPPINYPTGGNMNF